MRVTLVGGVFLLFLALKLLGVIAWSWWWITAPIWIPVALLVILLITILASYFGSRMNFDKRMK